MKLLVSTRIGQGDRPGDYRATVEGELVTPLAAECDSPERCGCGRGFPGLGSNRATTTATVVELRGFDRSRLALAVRDSLERGGWLQALTGHEVAELVGEHVSAIGEVCAAFPVGSVLGRQDALVFDRTPARA